MLLPLSMWAQALPEEQEAPPQEESIDLLDQILPKDRSYIRNGNRAYEEGRFAEATVYYQKAAAKNSRNRSAVFNQGDALYEQRQYEEAASKFSQAALMATEPENRAKAFHNLGNTHLAHGEKFEKEKTPQKAMEGYQKAVEAYKNALRMNPKDMDTKYNLAYAQEKLRQQQQNQQNQDQQQQDQEKKDDQKQDQQNQDQKQDQQQNQDQQQQDQQNQDQKQEQQNQQQQQRKAGEISKEDMERIMQRMQFEEQKLREKVQKKQQAGKRQPVDKDW